MERETETETEILYEYTSNNGRGANLMYKKIYNYVPEEFHVPATFFAYRNVYFSAGRSDDEYYNIEDNCTKKIMYYQLFPLPVEPRDILIHTDEELLLPFIDYEMLHDEELNDIEVLKADDAEFIDPLTDHLAVSVKKDIVIDFLYHFAITSLQLLL